jgi:hypothetical protein
MQRMHSFRDNTADRHRIAVWSSEITLRPATEADRPALKRLAQLEGAQLGDGPYLVAVRERVIQAAINVEDGELIADPFRRTAELCCLLRCHAGPLRVRQPKSSAPDPCLSPALAPA